MDNQKLINFLKTRIKDCDYEINRWNKDLEKQRKELSDLALKGMDDKWLESPLMKIREYSLFLERQISERKAFMICLREVDEEEWRRFIDESKRSD